MIRLLITAVAIAFPCGAFTDRAGSAETDKQSSLVLLPVPSDPSINFRIWFKVGSQDDPPGKEGLAAMASAMLAEGSTQQHSYQEIIELLFPLAAGYSANTGVEMTVISGRTHRDNVDKYRELLTQAILSPAWRQEDLDRLKNDVLNYLENTLRYASDEELGKAVLYNEVFAGTPYGHLPIGTIEGVKSITLDDLRNFYRTYYTRDNVVIGLGGGYDEALVQKLQESLNKLPAGKPAVVETPQPRPIDGLRVTIVEKETGATAISIGAPIDILRGDPAWYALALANSWLGEHRNQNGRLFQVIRDLRGLNYGDYTYIEHFPNGGLRTKPPQNVARRQQMFEIWIRPVPNETRHFALRAAMREFTKLVDNGLTDDQFELTRKFLRNYVLHYAPTTMERLGYALDDCFYQVPGSHLDLFRRAMSTLTRDQVNAAIRKHLQYKNLQIVIVTNDAKAMRESLISDAPSPIRYATPKPESVLNEDREIVNFPLKIEADQIKIVPVTDLFNK
jgi:zinc protease